VQEAGMAQNDKTRKLLAKLVTLNVEIATGTNVLSGVLASMIRSSVFEPKTKEELFSLLLKYQDQNDQILHSLREAVELLGAVNDE
jgi:hypothetical protein